MSETLEPVHTGDKVESRQNCPLLTLIIIIIKRQRVRRRNMALVITRVPVVGAYFLTDLS